LSPLWPITDLVADPVGNTVVAHGRCFVAGAKPGGGLVEHRLQAGRVFDGGQGLAHHAAQLRRRGSDIRLIGVEETHNRDVEAADELKRRPKQPVHRGGRKCQAQIEIAGSVHGLLKDQQALVPSDAREAVRLVEDLVADSAPIHEHDRVGLVEGANLIGETLEARRQVSAVLTDTGVRDAGLTKRSDGTAVWVVLQLVVRVSLDVDPQATDEDVAMSHGRRLEVTEHLLAIVVEFPDTTAVENRRNEIIGLPLIPRVVHKRLQMAELRHPSFSSPNAKGANLELGKRVRESGALTNSDKMQHK